MTSTIDEVNEIVAELLANTGALGGWLLGGTEPLAGAVSNPSVQPPEAVLVLDEAYLDLGEKRIFAQPIGPATLVFVFDDQSSLGLIRLRVRHTREAIEQALRGT